MNVSEIMTTDIITITMDDMVKKVRDLFDRNSCHHLLVVDKNKLEGVISDRDLLKNISPFIDMPLAERKQDTATLNRRVHQIMTRKAVTADPDMPIEDAARTMLFHKVSCLPVVNDQNIPIGIVTWRDLLAALIDTK